MLLLSTVLEVCGPAFAKSVLHFFDSKPDWSAVRDNGSGLHCGSKSCSKFYLDFANKNNTKLNKKSNVMNILCVTLNDICGKRE